MRRFAVLAVGLGFLCNGCNIDPFGSSSSKPPAIIVKVLPASVSLVVGTTQQFTSTVTGTTNAVIDWSIGGAPCVAGQDCGSITAEGLYTAPALIPSPNQITITGFSSAYTLDFGTSQVVVTATASAAAAFEGDYTFLVTGADAKGPVAVTGKFVADSAGQIEEGELSFCRGLNACTETSFAGAYRTTSKNQGTFTIDALPKANFGFRTTAAGTLELVLVGAQDLNASGILNLVKDIPPN